MLVWLIKHGEWLPIQPGSRKMRTWMMAEALLARGHEVVWWHSTFSHQTKSLMSSEELELEIEPDFNLALIHAGSYQRNVSLRRYRHHIRFARKFRKAAAARRRPDLIVAAYPIIDIACEATRYGRRHDVPVIVDVRDFWPDFYFERVPKALHRPLRSLLARDYRLARETLSEAHCLTGISQGILRWALRIAGRDQRSNDRVVYTGYPDDPARLDRQAFRRPAYLPQQKATVFTFLGSFGSSYDLSTVCDAAESLFGAADSDACVVLAGVGEQFDRVAARAANLPNLVVPGLLDADGINALLAHSDVGLIPCDSARDSMPNKIYEYFSAGLPVISSLEGEMEELIERYDVGLSYTCGDFAQLCDCLKRMQADLGRRGTMSRNARALYEQQFRGQDVYDDFAAYLEAMTPAPGGMPVGENA